VRREDIEVVHELWSSIAVKRHPLRSREESEARLTRTLASIEAGELASWAVTEPPSESALGFVGLCRFERTHQRAEVAYELLPKHWGKGLASRALACVVRHGFETLALHRLEGHVEPDNVRSMRVLERVGFVREGLLRENYFAHGVFHDTVVYGKIAP
jgi:ribosomal-protein-alanine N-acetyltransferase